MSAFVSYAPSRESSTAAPLRGLYVHVPFCHTICGYCDFYSEVYDKRAAAPLVDALLRELDSYAADSELRFDTIFVGGGTPTTLPPADLQRLLTRLFELRDPCVTLEFTSEANPATVTPEVADALVAGGVNRVSVGAQSFNRSELAVLERIHRPEQVRETLKALRAAGLHNINIDLIFGVPGQTLNGWNRNLDAALALGTEHLSCYGLTFEPGTPLHDQLTRGQVARTDNDLEARMYETTIDRLAAAGLQQYEISNFARPGRECRHNLRCWGHEHYLGIGPSAAGFIGNVRYKNVPDTAAYVRAVNAARSVRIEEERLTLADQAKDAAWLALRTTRGIQRRGFAERFGHDPAALFQEAVEKHVGGGLLEVDENAVRLTRRGLLLANLVTTDFI